MRDKIDRHHRKLLLEKYKVKREKKKKETEMRSLKRFEIKGQIQKLEQNVHLQHIYNSSEWGEGRNTRKQIAKTVISEAFLGDQKMLELYNLGKATGQS